MPNERPTDKQILYAKYISDELGFDLEELPFTKQAYWKYINDNKDKVKKTIKKSNKTLFGYGLSNCVVIDDDMLSDMFPGFY